MHPARSIVLAFLGLSGASPAREPVRVTVLADSGRKPISPWLYGRNGSLSNDSNVATSDSLLELYRQAGLRMLRENGGNNATKYNWRRKLSSHPDWYNNVSYEDWDWSASTLQSKLPGTQGLYAFPMLGWAARTDSANFDCWTYNRCAGGDSVRANWAGGGDPSLYLEAWPPDSSVGILDHWFGAGGLGLDSARFRYWNMDAEPDIWGFTHDDVAAPMDFETYFQKYLATAKRVRARSTTIKLVGPVLANEWMWWTWYDKTIDDAGVPRSPMEMFLKRVGEEERATGLRLLYVFDVHFYPGYDGRDKVPLLLQCHRVFFDTAYAWPDANGLHMFDGDWGEPASYHLYERVRTWMVRYLGEVRGLGLTEFGTMTGGTDVDARDVAYASFLGTFADQGGELLTPFEWYPGWWEVLHLFSRHARSTRVATLSSLDTAVSGYSSVNDAGDSLTVILVDRDTSGTREVHLRLDGFSSGAGATTLRLSGLSGETFVSHAQNALEHGSVAVSGDSAILTLPAKSITAVLFSGQARTTSAVARPTSSPRLSRVGTRLVLDGLEPGAAVELRTADGRFLSTRRAEGGRCEIDLRPFGKGLVLVRGGTRVWLAARP